MTLPALARVVGPRNSTVSLNLRFLVLDGNAVGHENQRLAAGKLAHRIENKLEGSSSLPVALPAARINIVTTDG